MTGWASLRAVLRLFRQDRRLLLGGGAALSAATVLAGVALLGLSGWFITATAIAGLSSAAALGFDVFQPSAGIRFLAILRTAARYGERLVTHAAALAVLAALRERLFRAYAAPNAARALLARPARLLFRLTADVDALDTLYLRLLVPAAAALATAAAVGIGLGLLDWQLGAALAAAVLVPGLGIPLWLARAAVRPARLRTAAAEALRARMVDLVAGQTDLALAGRLGAQRARIAGAEARLAEAEDALNRLEVRAGLLFGVVAALILSGALLAAAALAGSGAGLGAISAPQAALVVLVALAALEPFAALRRGALELGRTLIAARRLAPRLAAPPLPQARPAPPAGFALAIEGVTFRYDGAAAPLFRDLSLHLASGGRAALIGPSAAGKSTVLALLAGEAEPEAGRIRVARCGVLTQRTELFRDSLRGNLQLADPAADDTALWRALDRAGLGADVRALPAGLDAMLGEGGTGLSGGQARRLALARLLLRDAPLWLLDEPTEGLDRATAAALLTYINGQEPSVTILLATHLRREAALADRLFHLVDGRIVAEWRRGEAGYQAALDSLRPD